MRFNLPKAALCAMILLALAACGGGDGGSDDPPAGSTGNQVSGVAFKGRFSAGTVTISALDASGLLGATLGTGALNGNGQFTVDIGSHTGPIHIRVHDGNYQDEVTGNRAQTTSLVALLSNPVPNPNVVITPLTTMAATLAIRDTTIGGSALIEAITRSNTNIAGYFKISNMLTTEPAILSAGPASPGNAANYGALLAGISRQAFDLGVSPDDLVLALATDASDGALDGQGPGGPIALGAGSLPTDAANAALGTAIDSFLAGGANTSGLAAADFTVLLDRLANLGSNIFFIESIDVTPAALSVAQGVPIDYSASATWSDGSIENITATATWESTDTGVATITTGGEATPIGQGQTTIRASQAAPLGQVTVGETTLTVSGVFLVSIAVTPVDPQRVAGQDIQFTCTANFSDASSSNITTQVAWMSADTSVADINAAGLAQTGPGIGPVTITATLGAMSDQTTLTVIPRELVSIDVTPTNPALFSGDQQQFTATGTFNDQTNENLTATVNWQSANQSIATITAGGLCTAGLTGGPVDITATQGLISGQTTVTVTPVVLVSIAVTPTNPALFSGQQQQFTATGTFNNSTQQNLTGAVIWDTTDAGRATITAGGLCTAGQTGGPVDITATQGAITGQTTVTVTPVVLVSIVVTPANSVVLPGQQPQFTATGTFNNATQQNLTAQVNWLSSTTGVMTINSAGLATALAYGSTTISATDPGTNVSGNRVVNVAVSYAAHVQPVFNQNCISCHSGGGAPNNLRLSNHAELMLGAISGPVVVIGNPNNSELIRRLEGTSQPQMPNGAPPLPQATIDLIRDWITQGALNN